MQKFLFVNFKAYAEATGKKAVALAKKLEAAAKNSGVKLVFVVQATDVLPVSKNVKSKVFAQHFDANSQGAFTGSITVEALQAAGAHGSVLNHAEKKVSNEHISACILRANEKKFPVLLCAETVERAESFASLSPTFIAFEPPELIGGNVSVSTARPEIIKEFVQKVRAKNPQAVLLCGAGIKDSVDVKKALEFGCQGVFVASGIVKAQNPAKAIKEILNGFK